MTIYGIDLGTTYSCIAYVDKFEQPKVVPNGQSLVTPSVVFFENEENIVVGESAKRSARLLPEQTVELIKRSMGEADWRRSFFGTEYTPSSIAARIIDRLAQVAAADTGDDVAEIVITIPAYFTMEETQATRTAGEIAGFMVNELLQEPVAAAISYAYSRQETKEETIIVYDLGGGTFDVSVVKIGEGIEPDKIETISIEGHHTLGGRDWDGRIVTHFLSEFEGQTGVRPDADSEDEIDRQAIQDFYSEAETAKRELTTKESVTVSLAYAGKQSSVGVDRKNFEDLCSDLLETTVDLTDKAIQVARDKGETEFSRILLVGGSSYMPSVKSALEAKFSLNCDLYKPDEAIAMGAALFANGWPAPTPTPDNPDPEPIVINACPRNFGIIAQVEGSVRAVVYLLKKNDSAPGTKTETFYTIAANQQSVSITVIEADGTDLPENEPLPLGPHAHQLGEAYELDLPGNLPVESPIEVEFSISKGGNELEIEARDPVGGGVITGTLKGNWAPTEAEVKVEREKFTEITTVT